MKESIIAAAIFIFLLLFIPFAFTGTAKSVHTAVPVHASSSEASGESAAEEGGGVTVAGAESGAGQFRIRSVSTGREEDVAAFDFICGVVAGEMPVEYEPEALKAQAVAAFSYCAYLREHPTGDGSIVTGLHVAYLPRAQAQTLWGSQFDANWAKIVSAVEAVRGYALFYGGDVALACYSDMSSGTTESSADVWNQALPYLVEVPSPGDKLEKDYLSRVTVKSADFARTAEALPGAKLQKDPRAWLRVTKRSAAGGVLEAALGGKAVTGAQVRSWFGLRSANFSLSYKKGVFTFTVRGYGHGVGMSQCGAEYLAKQGKSWRQILAWYYRGAAVGEYDWSGSGNSGGSGGSGTPASRL